MAVGILLRVKSLQEQDGEQNIIDYQTRGYLYHKGQVTYLQYQEGTEGLEGVQTTLKLEKDRVTLIRHGDISMHQTFQTGVKDEGEYRTNFGSLPLSTDTELLEIVVGFDEGSIRVIYDIYLGDEKSSTNTMEVSYWYRDGETTLDDAKFDDLNLE